VIDAHGFHSSRRATGSTSTAVEVDGKQFRVGRERFPFRGVTYGTFRPRPGDGARFPGRDQAKRDLAAMAEAGFTVIRTYTAPPDDLVDLAADWGLRILAGVFYPDWRYLVGASRRQARQVLRAARSEVGHEARRLQGSPVVLGLVLGNEVPADVVRWTGASTVAGALDDLVETVREEDPDRLVSYANYPTTEYLALDGLDFVTFNVFLEDRLDFRRYLTRLHHLAGDRPLVLGEVGLHAGTGPAGERHQAQVLDWQLETALERGVAGTCVFSWTDEWWVGPAPVEGWRFGLCRHDRSPRPALDVAARWNRSSVRDLRERWPTMSVVVCAYNAAATLDECLTHACALDYPGLEVVVVDDGSTDTTAAVARRHPVRLLEREHAGLSSARNAGYAAATGEIVAYLDSDAYPSPEWPYYLALGFDGRTVGGVGGPNIPPRDDPAGAQVVARSPGGPVEVLVGDDRAEHLPGCNMAFWRKVLVELAGFDPIYTAAGDDVDLCWRVLDRGWDLGFHPAALVWHHRRPGLRAYLRQQRGYGRAEALVQARHPDRFTTLGTARWSGVIYGARAPGRFGQRIYRGVYGSAAYQSVYRGGGHGLDVAHQAGVPAALGALVLAALALPVPALRGAAAVATALVLSFVAGLAAVDVAGARPPTGVPRPRRFRLAVAAHHLLQPVVRAWGRWRATTVAWRGLPPAGPPLPAPSKRAGRSVLVLPHDRPRPELAAAVVGSLRRAGLRVVQPTGWEDHDARVLGSTVVAADVVTSAFPVGCVQLRLRRRLRWRRLALAALVAATVAVATPVPAAAIAAALVVELGRGWWRTGPVPVRAVRGGGR
jgi:GT2 family glycosyltransferase